MVEVSGNNASFSFSGIYEILTGYRIREISQILFRTLIVSLLSTMISYLVVKLLLNKTGNTFQFIFFSIVSIPFFINESIRNFSWQLLLSENGKLNYAVNYLLNEELNIFNGTNTFNVYFAMLLTCIPFGLFINAIGQRNIPNLYTTVSQDLKLTPFYKFFKVDLPLSKYVLIVTFFITFFVCFSLSTEVNFLGGLSKISLRNLVNSLMSASKFNSIFALGSIFALLIFLFSYIFIKNQKKLI